MSKGKALETFFTAHKGFYTKSQYKQKLTRDEYVRFMNDFAQHLLECILNSDTVYLPGRLGVIQISGKKKLPKITEDGIKGLSINWGDTNKLWKTCEPCKEKKQLVYNFNEHSEGLAYRFTWSRKSARFNTKQLYTFVPCRKAKRTLSSMIKNGKEYLILEGRDYLSIRPKQQLKTRNI